MSEDKKECSTTDAVEWNETLEMLRIGDAVTSDLSFGSYVTIKEELFQNMIQEINTSRIKNGNLGDGIDLIMIDEGEDDGNDSED